MNSLNSCIVEGTLTEEPSYQITPKGTPVCKFTIRSVRVYQSSSKTLVREESRFSIESWAKLAEQTNTLGHTGRGARVVGRLKEERWKDAQGNEKSRIIIVAEHIDFRPV